MTDQDKKKSDHLYFHDKYLYEDLKKRSIQGGFTTLGVQVLKFVLNLGANIILAHLLNPSDYGLFGMSAVVIGFVTLFKDMGLSVATVQKDKINHQQISTIFWINLGVSFLIMLITISSAPVIAQFYHETRLTTLTWLLSVGIFISGLGAQHAALLQREMYLRVFAINDLLSQFLGITACTISAWYGVGYWALAIYPLVTAATNTIGLWITCRWRPSFPSWNPDILSMLKFGGNLTGFGLLNYFARNLDNILIGRYWGSQSLGLYAKAYQMMLIPLTQINTSLSNVSVPLLSRLIDTPERYRAVYLQILQKILLVTTPIMVYMISASDLLVELLLGERWKESSPIFLWLGFTGIFQPIANSIGWLFISQNRSGELLQWGFISSIITIISFVIGLPWNSVGVARSYSVIVTFIVIPLLFWFVGKRGPICQKDFYGTVFPFAASAILTLVIIKYWRSFHPPISEISECILLTLAVFICFVSILYLFPQGKQSLKELKSITKLLRYQ